MEAIIHQPNGRVPRGIPENAHYEAGVPYWIEGTAASYNIMSAYGPGPAHPHQWKPYVIQRDEAWYPDEIFELEQAMLAEHEGSRHEYVEFCARATYCFRRENDREYGRYWRNQRIR